MIKTKNYRVTQIEIGSTNIRTKLLSFRVAEKGNFDLDQPVGCHLTFSSQKNRNLP